MHQYQLGDVANGHVLTQAGWLPVGSPYSPTAEADRKARSIATYERVSGVAWILIGLLQIAMVITFLAGIWNILAGISRLRIAPAIERRHHSVPDVFSGVGMLVAIGLVNLFFGAVFGVIMVAVDFAIRHVVLENRRIFTTHDASELTPRMPAVGPAPDQPDTSSDPTPRPGW